MDEQAKKDSENNQSNNALNDAIKDTDEKIRIYGCASDSIVDGPGLRFSVFTQGCTHACLNCHNPESHSTTGGQVRTISSIIDEIKKNTLIHDVTLTGGDPFLQAHASAKLAHRLKKLGYGVWTYTGYLFEDLLDWQGQDKQDVLDLLNNTDVLVDGPFIQDLKSYDLAWVGSSNQRIIDVKKSMQCGHVVLWERHYQIPKRPESW